MTSLQLQNGLERHQLERHQLTPETIWL